MHALQQLDIHAHNSQTAHQPLPSSRRASDGNADAEVSNCSQVESEGASRGRLVGCLDLPCPKHSATEIASAD